SGSNVFFLILYVDDIILMGNHKPSLQDVKDYLGKCFSMKDLEDAVYILEIKIYRDRSRTKDMFLVYGGNSDAELQVKCYCDAGFETDRDDTKSQTGYVFTLNGGTVVWKSSKQSTTAIFMAKEPGIIKEARHFQRKFHYVRECVDTGKIEMVKVHTDDNLADPFTKALAGPKLTRHARSMGLRPASSFIFNPSVTDRTVQGVHLDTFTAKVPSSRKTITERPPNENVDLFRNDITPPSGRTLFRQESTVDKMTGATDRERMPTYCPSPGVFGIIKGEGRHSILEKS
nr:hypothetical protein [Tanacetum cinerariifolium]